MQPTIYLLLIALGALLILAIFHLTIYLQQNDKAFRNYAFYLFAMAGFNVIRLLDARLTNIYPLSYYTVGTLDPIFSNLGLLFYANFLGVVLNIKKGDKIYYNSWKTLQYFVAGFVVIYLGLRISGDQWQLATSVITIASFCGLLFSLLMSIRLFRQRNEIFFQLIIAGTLVSLVGVLAGLAYNVFVVHESLAFGGMYFLEISILIEAIFLSAALGYRLKLASQERTKYQLALLDETQKREVLAVHTADLLKKQLDIQEVQNRISKDLHDDVGSSLSSLQIYSALAAKYVDTDPNQAKKMLEQITNNTSDIMENMGHIVWAMQPMED
ncbi:MAG: histidine kinase, partial [Ferruginibacter sp.]